MEKRKPPCTVAWCEAPHDDDTQTIAKHRKTLGELTLNDSSTVTAVARWAERLDGSPGVLPHITVTSTSLPAEYALDLTPREAIQISELMESLWTSGGVPWLAATLAAGAETLAPHEGREHDGMPHYVAEIETSEGDER